MKKNRNLEYYSNEKVLKPSYYVQRELDLILAEIKKSGSASVVDFGAGAGRLAIEMLRNGYSVSAVEIDRDAIKKLDENAKKIGLEKRLKITKNLRGRVYIIAGTDVLHHLDLDVYLPLFHKHLLPKGRIIFSEPNPLNIFWWFFIFLFADFQEEFGIKNCSYFSLKKRLMNSGYRKIAIKGLYLLPPQLIFNFKFLERINRRLGENLFLKFFAFRFIVTAEK